MARTTGISLKELQQRYALRKARGEVLESNRAVRKRFAVSYQDDYALHVEYLQYLELEYT